MNGSVIKRCKLHHALNTIDPALPERLMVLGSFQLEHRFLCLMDVSKAGAYDHSRETTTVLQTTAKSSLAKYETLKYHPEYSARIRQCRMCGPLSHI